MNIQEFKSKLQPVKKGEVLNLLKNHRDQLEGAADNLRLMSSEGIRLEDTLKGWKETPRFLKAVRGNIPAGITLETIISGAMGNAFQLIEQLQKDFATSSNIMGKETVTVKELNGLLLDSYLSFWSEYLSRLMDMMTSMMVKGKSAEQVAQKPDLEYLSKNIDGFGELTYTLFERGGIVMKRYRALPKLVADDQTLDVLEQTKGKDSVLALPVRNIAPHELNPFYWWDLVRMEHALKSYAKHQNSIEANALKISYYRDLQHQQPSPANERMIEVLESKIIKAQAAMEEIEQRYA